MSGQIQEVTLNPPEQGKGGTLVLVAATVGRLGPFTAAQEGYYTITPDALTFCCRGGAATNPVAGTDQVLLANNSYRVGPFKAGQYLCFISTPGGNVYWTPGS